MPSSTPTAFVSSESTPVSSAVEPTFANVQAVLDANCSCHFLAANPATSAMLAATASGRRRFNRFASGARAKPRLPVKVCMAKARPIRFSPMLLPRMA